MIVEDLNHHFSAAVAEADQALVEGGRVDPLYLIVGRDLRAQFIGADHTSPERKHVSMELAKLAAIAADAEIVIHRTEAWIVLGDATPGVPPSMSDRRREVVLVLGAARDADGAILMRLSAREIPRAEDGAATDTVPLDVPEEGGELLGPLGNLLRPDSPTQAERRAARATIERATKRMARGKAAFVIH